VRGWFTKDHPKNGDWRRFAISKQMCVAVQEHIEEYGLGPDDLLFPRWMFAYVRSAAVIVDDDENLPPLLSNSGVVYEHGTKGAPVFDEMPLQEMQGVCRRLPAPVASPAERTAGQRGWAGQGRYLAPGRH
jgi:hypothetical protein